MLEEQIKNNICEIGRRMYTKGFVAGNDGNISVRTKNGEIWTTPTGVSKGYMEPDMLVKLSPEGDIIEGNLKPSSEIKMHLAVYRERPDVNAVVHTHSPYATAFACSNIKPDNRILAEALLFLGSLHLVEYATPSTNEVPDNLKKYLRGNNAFLLQNHGALTIGSDLTRAYFTTENLEHFCKIYFILSQLGNKSIISEENIAKLEEIKAKLGL